MIDLAQFHPDFRAMLAREVESITRAPPAALGPLCEEACVTFRAAAIAEVLIELDSDAFHHLLIRSALTRAYLLARTPPLEKDTSRFCRISRASGLFDALASGQIDVARRLIALGPQQRNARFEYEEDYAYVSFLHGLLLGRGEADQKAILEEWSALLDGARSAKLEVCRALSKGDPAVFDGAFLRLLDARKRELEEQERSTSRDEMEFAGGRHVYVEGLALLRLAESLGMATRPEYDYCPRETRQPMRAPFPDDLYPR